MPRIGVAIVVHLNTLIRIAKRVRKQKNNNHPIKSAVEPQESNHTFTFKVGDEELYLETKSAEKVLFDSVQAATRKGVKVNFDGYLTVLITPDRTTFQIQQHGRLYSLCKRNINSERTESLQMWHRILGIVTLEDIKRLTKIVNGVKINDTNDFDCETCILSKETKIRYRGADVRAKERFELVHTYLAGPTDPIAKDGFRYVIIFVDDYSGCNFTYFLKKKSDVMKATNKFLADINPYGRVKTFSFNTEIFLPVMSNVSAVIMVLLESNKISLRSIFLEQYVIYGPGKKLDPRSRKGQLVGYDCESPAYLVYYPETRTISRHDLVTFTEKFQIATTESHALVLPPNDAETEQSTGKAATVEEPVSQAEQLRYPSLNRQPPSFLEEYDCTDSRPPNDTYDNFNCIDYCYMLNAPKSYRETQNCNDSEH
eukprot:gene5796-6493_t